LKYKAPGFGLLLFMLWNMFSFVREMFNVEDCWDWKMLLLNYSFSILVPLAIVFGVNYEFLVKTFRFIISRLLSFICILITNVVVRVDSFIGISSNSAQLVTILNVIWIFVFMWEVFLER